MQEQQIRKLTLAGMFAALAFACFSYLRIEIPMGMGLTGKIYVGHAFILLSALVLGARYGALSRAIGLGHLDRLTEDRARLRAAALASIFGSMVNVITEPLIRYSFKVFILGLPQPIAYVSAINCAVSMAVSNVVSVVLAVVLYRVMEKSIGL